MNSIKDLSYISVENQNQDFPRHFHETFCVSLIRSGTEKIEFDNDILYTGKNRISITNPYEIHANPLIDKDVNVCFDTLYISGDLMTFLLDKKRITFTERQIHNTAINNQFLNILELLKSNTPEKVSVPLKNFVKQLYPYSQTATQLYEPSFQSGYLEQLVTYIEQNLENKIYLDELAKIVHLNKFGFTKKFKLLTGMTPMSYVLMKKVFSAKAKFTADCNIADIACLYNFTDIAHFSHCFKKYTGISPKKYREQLKK